MLFLFIWGQLDRAPIQSMWHILLLSDPSQRQGTIPYWLVSLQVNYFARLFLVREKCTLLNDKPVPNCMNPNKHNCDVCLFFTWNKTIVMFGYMNITCLKLATDRQCLFEGEDGLMYVNHWWNSLVYAPWFGLGLGWYLISTLDSKLFNHGNKKLLSPLPSIGGSKLSFILSFQHIKTCFLGSFSLILVRGVKVD